MNLPSSAYIFPCNSCTKAITSSETWLIFSREFSKAKAVAVKHIITHSVVTFPMETLGKKRVHVFKYLSLSCFMHEIFKWYYLRNKLKTHFVHCIHIFIKVVFFSKVTTERIDVPSLWCYFWHKSLFSRWVFGVFPRRCLSFSWKNLRIYRHHGNCFIYFAIDFLHNYYENANSVWGITLRITGGFSSFLLIEFTEICP